MKESVYFYGDDAYDIINNYIYAVERHGNGHTLAGVTVFECSEGDSYKARKYSVEGRDCVEMRYMR